jgi:hypothetical protein
MLQMGCLKQPNAVGELTTVDCTMEDGRSSPFPVLLCRNIYVLPGVPHLLQLKWKVGNGSILES